LNAVGKKVTPLLGRAVNGMGATGLVEFAASYLNLSAGKGVALAEYETKYTPERNYRMLMAIYQDATNHKLGLTTEFAGAESLT
jgi:hypothetical protein